MYCMNCGAENPEGKMFCSDCGGKLEAMPAQPVSQYRHQADQVATASRASSSLSAKTKRREVVGGIAVSVALITVSVLGYLYYYQPVRGSGSVSSTTIDAGQGVQFGFIPIQGISPYRYSWFFGDGGISREQNPHHSFVSPGYYITSVTVSDTAGKTSTWTTTITVNSIPSATGTVSPSIGVLSLNASFTAQGQGGTPDFSYYWQFGDGTSSDVQNPTHHYSLGNYTATVVVKDGGGMTASWSVGIRVNHPLITGVTYRYIGPGDTEEFTCTPSQGVPPYSYFWDFGDGRNSTLQNPVHSYDGPGLMTGHLTVKDSIGETVKIQMVFSV